MVEYQNNIYVGGFRTGHVQGIAVDKSREHMYYSFTTCFVKTDMEGRVIGTVKGLAGHLGCIAYREEDGRVYGSLEYKHDSIGAGILNNLGCQMEILDGFYMAIFDVEKIDRMDMDAEKDGIMKTVYLKEVVDDFKALHHRYGCSGIDGTTFAPIPGSTDGKKYLYVAYGIYGDLERDDNDYQVILRYDMTEWKQYERPLNQADMHTVGPEKPESKYFVYTGNTLFGIQNLEYDPYTGYLFAAVYRGAKPKFPNYPMFVIDLSQKAQVQKIKGVEQEGEVLALAKVGSCHENTGIYGLEFPYGSTGMISLGDGFFYISHEKSSREEGDSTTVKLYQYDEEKGFVLV